MEGTLKLTRGADCNTVPRGYRSPAYRYSELSDGLRLVSNGNGGIIIGDGWFVADFMERKW